MRWLAHHGVKGQQWGVRNGPPYPIEDKVLKAGTKLSNVSSVKSTSQYLKCLNTGKRWIYTYVSDNVWDKNIYEGPFADYLSTTRKQGQIYKHNYEVKKDLKMPTSNERMAVMKNMMKTNDAGILDDMDKRADLLRKYIKWGNKLTPALTKASQFNSKDKKDKEYYEKAKYVFDNLMEYSIAQPSTRRYSEIMAEKYDAMVDDNNVNIYNFAQDPIIIFKVDEALKAVGNRNVFTGQISGKPLYAKEVRENIEKVREQNRSKGYDSVAF